ncbi:hypothetical protein A2165_01210 [Candidatus Curtissbacteria bacterium RBG_13_40_7]|uniref:Yip1 domain-containing protein n=1 Tax=Candidatus Curtissbacteria bacterium RBG_13_40_7 TaxID=1797706 RepID=A0A1F5FW64_9BACT|nr:MAG: hypothetical protein A2165_01210 [Candidatus Curtissbacteria bacterium RBG_13_40_7]
MDRAFLDSLVDLAIPNLAGRSVGEIIGVLIPYIYGIVGFLLLLYAVSAGYQILTSGGGPKALVQAKDKITNAIVGFIIMFSSYWIVQLLARILRLQKIIDIFG